jgi:hypothetical protein
MKLSSRQIGWSQTANLLYQLKKKLAGKNGDVSKEIGWSTEDNLIYGIQPGTACAPCYVKEDCLIEDSDDIVIMDSDNVEIEDYCPGNGDFDPADFSMVDFA